MFSQATNYSEETKEILVEWEQILPTKYLHSDHTDKALGMRVQRVVWSPSKNVKEEPFYFLLSFCYFAKQNDFGDR